MKAATANLKIFYQRPALYFWYFIILMQIPTLLIFTDNFDMRNHPGTMQSFLITMILGMVVGSLQKDILCRPVSFCLPGHRKISQKLIFIMGTLFAMIPIVIFFEGIMSSTNNYLMTIAAIWTVGMAAYLSSVWIAYQDGFSSRGMNWVTGIWLIMFFGMMLGGHKMIWLVALDLPVALIVPSLAIIIYFWFHFRKDSHVRSFCGQQTVMTFNSWDMQKANALRTAQFIKKLKSRNKLSLLLEEFLVGKMKADPKRKNKAIFGAIYTAFDKMFVGSLLQMLPMVFMLILFGYIYGNRMSSPASPFVSILDIFYIMPVFGALMHAFPPHSTLHIPASRKEKFHASFLMAAVFVVFAMVFMGVFVGLVNIIAPYMPKVPGHIFNPSPNELSFVAPKLSHLYIVPMLMPIGFSASVLFGNKKTGMLFAGPVVFICCWAYVFSQTFLNTAIVVPCIFAVSWLSFIAILQRHCLKRNLV